MNVRRRSVLFMVVGIIFGMAIIFNVYQYIRPVSRVNLEECESNIFSQSGEDGLLSYIFTVIEPSSLYAVEFGCSDGVQNSNSRNLIINCGWSALLMDGDREAIEKAIRAYEGFPKAKVVEAWIYPGNVEDLFDKYEVPYDLDLLSIDIDSNDYYVWRVIHNYRPKVVIIEYNASFPPPEKAVINFHPMNYWDHSDYMGASIQSLYELGKNKGYEMIYCTSSGTNLIFVDRKYFRLFGIQDNNPAAIYRPPKYGKPGTGRAPNGLGHPRWDTFEVPEDGKLVKPFAKDLTWEMITIPKRYVALPYSKDR